MAAEFRTMWKRIVVKSSVEPGQPLKVMEQIRQTTRDVDKANLSPYCKGGVDGDNRQQCSLSNSIIYFILAQ